MAKAFANYTTDRTIHFILWGAEEQGLVGSNYYVDNLGQTGYNVVYSLIMDMIGYSNVYHGVKIETSSSVSGLHFSFLFSMIISPLVWFLFLTFFFSFFFFPFMIAIIIMTFFFRSLSILSFLSL